MTRAGAPLGPERRRAHLRIVDERWDDGGHTEGQLDALTGLPNRLGWDETITRGDAARARSPVTASVVALDVDGLTLANETRGHDFGDELLRTVASLVRRVIRDEDLVARIGGDEFGVLLPEADETACTRVVTRLREAFATATSLDGFPVSVAVGAATAASNETLTRAERWADARLFVDKTEPSRLEFLTA
jgi:diguanylate cyclase (GGDEF)-like protein